MNSSIFEETSISKRRRSSKKEYLNFNFGFFVLTVEKAFQSFESFCFNSELNPIMIPLHCKCREFPMRMTLRKYIEICKDNFRDRVLYKKAYCTHCGVMLSANTKKVNDIMFCNKAFVIK